MTLGLLCTLAGITGHSTNSDHSQPRSPAVCVLTAKVAQEASASVLSLGHQNPANSLSFNSLGALAGHPQRCTRQTQIRIQTPPACAPANAKKKKKSLHLLLTEGSRVPNPEQVRRSSGVGIQVLTRAPCPPTFH